MEYPIRKGLEMPIMLSGCTLQNFYIYLGVSGIIGSFLVISLVVVINTGGWKFFFLEFFLGMIGLIVVKVFLMKKSKVIRLQFGKRETTITNRDILESL